MKKKFLTLSGLEENVMLCDEYFFLITNEEIENNMSKYYNIEGEDVVLIFPDGFHDDYERNYSVRNRPSGITFHHIPNLCLDEDFTNWANFYGLSNQELKHKLTDLHNPENSVNTKVQLKRFFYKTEHPLMFAKLETIKEDIRFYNPFNDAYSLFTELSKLKIWDLKELKRFVKIYGLPSGDGIYKRTSSYESKNILFYSVELEELFAELTTFKYIFSLFIALKTKNIKQLQFFINKHHRSLKMKNDEEFLLYGTQLLSNLLNRENRTFQKLIIETVNDKAEVVPIVQYTDLFDVAYFQITKSLLEDTKLRKCEHCGYFFETDHKSRRFCPPLPFRKRSSCETAYNRKKIRG